MRRAVALVLVSALLVSSLGCFTAGVSSPAARLGDERRSGGVTWFWGLTSTVKYAEECRTGLAEVQTWVPWYAYIVSPLTLGILPPMRQEYICARP